MEMMGDLEPKSSSQKTGGLGTARPSSLVAFLTALVKGVRKQKHFSSSAGCLENRRIVRWKPMASFQGDVSPPGPGTFPSLKETRRDSEAMLTPRRSC